jgi:hypothetical protein
VPDVVTAGAEPLNAKLEVFSPQPRKGALLLVFIAATHDPLPASTE